LNRIERYLILIFFPCVWLLLLCTCILAHSYSVNSQIIAPIDRTSATSYGILMHTCLSPICRYHCGCDPAILVHSCKTYNFKGVAEILGGWMIWVAVRGNAVNSSTTPQKKPWWYAILGSILLVTYGFLPCLQPTDSFGRIYAIYGGFFIVLSFLFGWALDGDKPDLGDVVGGSIALVGVFLVMFWPRG